VLVTDHEGRVIGSADPGRVGQLHEASVEVVRRRVGAAHDARAAGRLVGVKPGVTLPLFVGREIVGTVGITGDPTVVRSFGEIVRRQTEIMLRQTMLLRQELLRERALEQLVQDIASYDLSSVDADLLHTQAEELGLRIDTPRAAVAIAVAPATAAAGTTGGTRDTDRQSLRLHLIRVVRERFTGGLDIIAAVGADAVVVLADLASRGGPTPAVSRLEFACREAVREIAQRFDTEAWAGIGTPADGLAQLPRSYHDAWSALRLGRRIAPERRLHHAHDFRIWELLVEVSPRQRQAYRDALLEKLTAERSWPELRRTIVAWLEQGFRAVDTADALRIHRNTLQYRLDRISAILGEDIRSPHTALSVYLACLMEDLDDRP
jgi:carbohydrate diacid regulator